MLRSNVNWIILFFSLALFACSEKENAPDFDDDGTEITTTVSVQVPELFKSRAVPDVYKDAGATYIGESGMPSVGNVDLKEHPLTFTVGIYIAKTVGNSTTYTLVSKQSQEKVSNDEAYFNFRLLKGQKYRLVAYADFAETEKANLEKIEFATVLNDELSDAFFASQDFIAYPNVYAVLKRPFGKLRLIARDFDVFAAGEVCEVTGVTVDFKRQAMLATTEFNALSGDFNYQADGDATKDHTKTAKPVIYSKEYNGDGTAEYAAVFTMYLPANIGTPDPNDPYKREDETDATPIPQSWMYPLDVSVTYNNRETGKTTTIKRSFDIDIPVKRNYLTTIDAADFWTDNSTVKVSVDHRFEGFITPNTEVHTVMNEDELQKAIDDILDHTKVADRVGSIVLGADITNVNRGGFVIDRAGGCTINLDLNGHSITVNEKGDRGYTDFNNKHHNTIGGVFGIRNAGCKLYITDTKKYEPNDPRAEIRYVGPNDNTAIPVIYCYYGGRVYIKAGRYINETESEVVYVYESEDHHAGIQKAVYDLYPYLKNGTTDPDLKENFDKAVKSNSSCATIYGGWFQNAQTGTPTGDRNPNVTINAYNTREKDNNGDPLWAKWSDWLESKGLPGWGPYQDVTFGYMYVYGGSFVDFNPALGDNICGNWLNKWVPDNYVSLNETIDGHNVYTVVAKKSPTHIN